MDLLLYKKESGKTLKTQKYKPKNQPTLLSTPRKSQTPFWGQSGGWLESQASLAESSLSHMNSSRARGACRQGALHPHGLRQAPSREQGGTLGLWQAWLATVQLRGE